MSDSQLFTADLLRTRASVEVKNIPITFFDDNGKEFSAYVIPWCKWSIRNKVINAAANHKAAAAGQGGYFTLLSGQRIQPSEEQITSCTHLAHRIVDAEGNPLGGDPLTEGLLLWLALSETDATLYNAVVGALNTSDFPVQEVADAKKPSEPSSAEPPGENSSPTSTDGAEG